MWIDANFLLHVNNPKNLYKTVVFTKHLSTIVCSNMLSARGVHSLLSFAYMCVRDLFIRGVIYLAKKN